MNKIDELLDIMARLRDPARGCPWDREQSFATLVPHTIEEAYEVAETIEHGDMDALRDELGDLLFQVVFYARLAEEQARFAFTDVVAAIVDKLVRRHPHVFGAAQVASAEEQTHAWEAHKARERAAKSETRPSLLDGVTHTLPALTRAVKLQKRAARVGFDWQDACAVVDKIDEEAEEIREERARGGDPQRLLEEIGDLLFTAVNLARHQGIDPETALRRANRRFEQRFRRMETLMAAQGRTLEDADQAEMDALWEQVKAELAS